MLILNEITDQLFLFATGKVHILNLNDSVQQEIEFPAPILPPNRKKAEEDEEASQVVISACLSRQGHLALVLRNKQIIVYDSQWTVVKNTISQRVGSKIRFTPLCNLLLADKTGDVYEYQLNTERFELVLGHLSMLLDVVLAECGKYIITCDRDEKIRVSHYPNAYNIQSYCLGHKEFVSQLESVDDILVSASGDGNVRFWDFARGEQLHVIETDKYVTNREILIQFNKDVDNVQLSALPITDLQLFVIESTVFVAVTIVHIDELFIFAGGVRGKIVAMDLRQKIQLNSANISFCLGAKTLIVNDHILYRYDYCKERKMFIETTVYDCYEALLKSLNQRAKNDDMTALYKKRFDNVQEYLDRKKLRLANKPS